jgi:Co/Zn/Cd efflux system component
MSLTLSQTVRIVAALNLAYFAVEFAFALTIGSVSLFADSVDFVQDAAVNFLIFAGLDWTTRSRARLGMVRSGLIQGGNRRGLYRLQTRSLREDQR